jgi:tRNA threonylcarbamoyl adenosine modification protein (Sua5/YciO/YrdC/YwlC family)
VKEMRTSYGHLSNEQVLRAKHMLDRGGMLITPSDTGYALTVDARDARATAFLRQVLSLPVEPISVVVSGPEMLSEYAALNLQGLRLSHHLMPGPLTLVAPLTALGEERLGSNLNSDGTIGVRIPQSPAERQLAHALQGPVSTTAIRDDRGDLVTDYADVLALVEAGLESAVAGPDHYPTLQGVVADMKFAYGEHSTVAAMQGDGRPPVQIREGATPWRSVESSARAASSAEVSEWS